jgi:hypothetical protein
MSDELLLHLTHEEGAVALMLIALGTDAYEGNVPNRDSVELLDQMPPRHLLGLKKKLDAVADVIFRGTTNGK